MRTRSGIRSKLSFGNIVAGGAIALVLTAGTAYAANEWTGNNIVNGSLTGADIGANSVSGAKITNGTIGSKDVKNNGLLSIDYGDGSVTGTDIADSTIQGVDVATGSLGGSDIIDGTIGSVDIASGGVTSSEVADGSLQSGDLSLYYANVTAAGALNESSGGIFVTGPVSSRYTIDFGRDVSQCAATANTGGPDTQVIEGAFIGIWDSGTDNQDIIVDTENQAGADTNLPFHLIVVC